MAVAHVKAGKPDLAKPILIAIVRDEGAPASLRARSAQLAVALGVAAETLGASAQPVAAGS